jgi:hypothetical protein
MHKAVYLVFTSLINAHHHGGKWCTACKPHNTIEHTLWPKLSTTDNIYNNSGTYQLNCLECPKKYTDQTGYRILPTHIHILDTGHTYGNIESTMTVIRKARKGKFLNSLEKYYIFLDSKQEIHMNEFNVDHSDTVYETMYQKQKRILIDSSTLTSPIPNKNKQTHHTPRHSSTHYKTRSSSK